MISSVPSSRVPRPSEIASRARGSWLTSLSSISIGLLEFSTRLRTGYMAAAVASDVREVEAVDVSEGVLECPRVLNGAPSIQYLTPADAGRAPNPSTSTYSFAVVQHLSDSVLADTLRLLRRRVRPGGTLLPHYSRPDQTWRTEDEWRHDAWLKGRARLRFGLHCSARPDAELLDMVVAAGFEDPCTDSLEARTSANDDVAHQELLVARG